MQNKITGPTVTALRLLAAGAAVVFGLMMSAWAEEGGLVLEDAWVRAMPPGRPMTAAYLRIENPLGEPVTITSVSADRGSASLHESRQVDGQMQMRELSELAVPAGGEAVLEPGGLHIMLMGLETTPAEGDTLTLCIQSSAGEVCTAAPDRRCEQPQQGIDHDERRQRESRSCGGRERR